MGFVPCSLLNLLQGVHMEFNRTQKKKRQCVGSDSPIPLMVDHQIQSRWCSLMVWLKLWVRSPPASPKHKQKYYDGILSRNFKYSCTDCIVHVWLSCTDCGCLESATRMGNDSDPVPQTNLGLTSLYSLLFLSQQESYLWIDYPQVRFLHMNFMLFNERTCRGVYMGSMLVAHHFLSRDFALGFSNSKPMYTL